MTPHEFFISSQFLGYILIGLNTTVIYRVITKEKMHLFLWLFFILVWPSVLLLEVMKTLSRIKVF